MSKLICWFKVVANHKK